MEIDPALFEENERTAPVDSGRLSMSVGPLDLGRRGCLPAVDVAYETWGVLDATGSNAILVCHALSGDSHAVGWWSRLVGPGKAIDTERYFVVCANVLGGCQGTTGPASSHPDGRRWGSRFPLVTVEDMAECHARLLRGLGVERLALAAGGSMGGMQVLALASGYPGLVERAWVTASAARHSAMQIGFNELGRQAVMRDPRWLGGEYAPDSPPASGLAIARMAGHLTYLSEASFSRKFGRRLQDKEDFSYSLDVEFQVESYLRHQGDKFVKRFDANSYLVLTRAIDYFSWQTSQGLETEFLFTSFGSDWIYQPYQSEELLRIARSAGARGRHVELSSELGHDAFLLDDVEQAREVRALLGS